MKGKVIKENSDERWREKRIKKEISKKVQNKKDYFTHKMILKNHKRREKTEEKKKKKKMSHQFVEKTTSFLIHQSKTVKKMRMCFIWRKKERKRKPERRVTKKSEKLFFKTEKRQNTDKQM